MPPDTEVDLTGRVIDQLDRTPDDRLRTIMKALVQHLHAFASEVRLTDPEDHELAGRAKRRNDGHGEPPRCTRIIGLNQSAA